MSEKTMQNAELANGPIVAILVSAGIGCLVLGLNTVGAEVSTGFKEAMNWWNPAGPLSGKTGYAVIAWLISWGALHLMWRKRELAFNPYWIASLIMIFLGFLLTFPPVFVAFARH